MNTPQVRELTLTVRRFTSGYLREEGITMSKIIAALRAKKSEPSLKQAAWYFWY
ncbi:hypothetical protein ACWGNF_03600 [Streptomyces sp. NPDC055808]|uniref:hypothetical protein n=1 Tax=Streptomyces sp. NPDC001828 TaxID=3364615 RepID=UPI00368679C9